ncbi:MAG: hypothetical protein Solivirus4_19 [Solivirus sp.]|uniref:Uncharacterized protein n=1 Tax=Solivirus sp. TaxID=2487772 RepID=A0A3G5AG02_9VIRU|nr:MAG: hypothetical protein Solivirus4_19 [Solivirus sp.]
MLAAGQTQPVFSNVGKYGVGGLAPANINNSSVAWNPSVPQPPISKTYNPHDDRSGSSTTSTNRRPNIHTSNLSNLQQTHSQANFTYASNFGTDGVKPLNITKNTNPDVPRTPTASPISVGIPADSQRNSVASAGANPPIGSMLQTVGDKTPVRVTRLDEPKNVNSNLSGLTSLPKVPNVAVSLPTLPENQQQRSTQTTKRDIEMFNTVTANLIEQYKQSTTPRISVPTATVGQYPTGVPVQQPQVQPPPTQQLYTQAQMEYMKTHQIPQMEIPTKPLDYSDPTAIYTPGQEAKIRADFRVKFSILRDHSPNMIIPEPPDTMPIYLINAAYLEYIKKIHVESSVEQNKTYLLIVWLLIEVFACRMCNLPCAGFTTSQFKYMNKYQLLLIELGEKSYTSGVGSPWPIEVRLFFMASMNAVIFVLVKMLSDYLGTDQLGDQLREMISELLTSSKGANVIKRAQEATSDNIPPPQAEAAPPMGNLGGIIAQLAQSMLGGNGGGLGGLASGLANAAGGAGGAGAGGGQANAPPAAKQRPTPYGSRKRD